jgi:lysozyme
MTPAGLNRLKLDEGLSLTAYPDPLSPLARELAKKLKDRTPGWEILSGAPWTIGYGQTGKGIAKDTVWTQAQADGAILASVNLLAKQLSSWVQVFDKLSPVRRDVLINIAYNIGLAGLMKWQITLAAIGRYDYVAAADDIRNNRVWKSQVGKRTTRCADAFELDTW